MSFDVTRDDGRIEAQGTLKMQPADFSMEPYTAMMGALANAPELTFRFDVRGAAL